MVVRSGNFVHDEAAEGSERATATLSIDSVHHQRGDAVVDDGSCLHRERSEVSALTRREFQQRGRDEATTLLNSFGVDMRSTDRFYRLADHGAYVLTFSETVSIPSGHIGIVEPRDVLLDSGAVATTRFVLPGEETVTLSLTVDDEIVLLSESATVADVVVVERAAP